MASLSASKTEPSGSVPIESDAQPRAGHPPRGPNSRGVHVKRAADLFIIKAGEESELDDSRDVFAELGQLFERILYL